MRVNEGASGNEATKGLETGPYRPWLPSDCAKFGFIFGDACGEYGWHFIFFNKDGVVPKTTLRQKRQIRTSKKMRGGGAERASRSRQWVQAAGETRLRWKSLSHARLWDPMDYTVHGILQARILEWVPCLSSRGSSQPRSLALRADSLPAEPPGKPKKTGVGSLSLLQRIFQTQESNPGVSCTAGRFFTNWATRKH